jgi:23S rRNA (pseudouridine1915-N3)-methyltransferase
MWSIISIGHTNSPWITEGLQTYQKRLKKPYALSVITCPPPSTGPDPQREGLALIKAIPQNACAIALDASGIAQTSETFAHALAQKHEQHRHIAFLIGGANGLSPAVYDACEHTWALSALTFPHKLVQIILAEQLYRAMCILQRHPYHRGH